jgi:hypothetical protein
MKKILFACSLLTTPIFSQSLVETIQAVRGDESRRTVVRPSEIFTELSALPGADAKADALLQRLSTHFQSTLTKQTLAEVRAQISQVIADRNGSALDAFPTVRLERIPLIQQALYLNRAVAKGALVPPVRSVTFQLDGKCKTPVASHPPAVADLFIDQSQDPIDFAVESCYAQNSEALSIALNRLAESPRDFSVVFATARKHTVYPVAKYSELLAALGTHDFSTEVFTKRTLVDFFGDTFAPPGGPRRDVRLVLWIRVPLPHGDSLNVPAEHGDFGFLLTRDGKNRFAESRYFIGVPSGGQTDVSFWRPRAVKNAAWTESRIEFVRTYAPAQAINAKHWLEAGASALRAFDRIQKAYAFPASAYGYYVCNDSVALALAKYADLSGTKERISHLFPLMRITSLELPDEKVQPLDSQFAKALGISTDFLNTLYPSDPALATDPVALKERLLLAYPATDKARLKHFPEAQTEFELKLW